MLCDTMLTVTVEPLHWRHSALRYFHPLLRSNVSLFCVYLLFSFSPFFFIFWVLFFLFLIYWTRIGSCIRQLRNDGRLVLPNLMTPVFKYSGNIFLYLLKGYNIYINIFYFLKGIFLCSTSFLFWRGKGEKLDSYIIEINFIE